jgi:hypothetical protein
MIAIIQDDYSYISNNDYPVFYNRSHPITNEQINLNFNLFYNNVTLYQSENYPDYLFIMANEIIRLFNIRRNTRDVIDYIEISKTLWTKLNNFQISNDFYMNTINEQQVELELNSLFTSNNIITKEDTLETLQAKRDNLSLYFVKIKEMYTQILTRLYNYVHRELFKVKSYERRITNSLNYNIVLETNILSSFDREIENRKNVNHRRAVLMQCINKNFGFQDLKQIDTHLIYKIDSYLSNKSL